MKKLDMLEIIGIIYLLIAVFIAFFNRSNVLSNVSWLVMTVSTVIGFIVAYLTVNIQQKHIVLLICIIIIMAVFTVYTVQNGIFWQTYGALLMGFGSGIFLFRKGERMIYLMNSAMMLQEENSYITSMHCTIHSSLLFLFGIIPQIL